MRGGIIPLILLLATAWAYTDTLMPENCASNQFIKTADAQASCSGIASSSLTAEEKKQAVMSLVYPTVGYIDAEFLHSWNKAWQYDDAPLTADPPAYNGPHYCEDYVIKNAWMEIVAITPMVNDTSNGKTFATPHGEVQVELNYTIIPKGTKWDNGGGQSCQTCNRRECVMGASADKLTVTLRGGEVEGGTGDAATVKKDAHPYSTDTEPLVFEATLEITGELTMTEWNPYCSCSCKACPPPPAAASLFPLAGKSAWLVLEDPLVFAASQDTVEPCDHCCDCECECGRECKHDCLNSTRTIPIRYTITDSKTVDKLYTYGFHVMQVMDTPTHGVVHVFSLAPLNEFYVRIGSAYYRSSEWDYGLQYDYPPYNTLHGLARHTGLKEDFRKMTVRRTTSTDAKAELIAFKDNPKYGDPLGTARTLIEASQNTGYAITHTIADMTIEPDALDTPDCEMSVSSHFERLKVTGFCNTTSLPVTGITITTDKAVYNAGEAGTATIRMTTAGQPLQGQVEVYYGGQRHNLTTNAAGIAVLNFRASDSSSIISASYTTDLVHSSASSNAGVDVQHPQAWANLEAIAVLCATWFMVYIALRALAGRVKA